MNEDLERGRRLFGEVANEYDRIRLEYPESLIDAILSYCGGTAIAALEVGAGTGKATLALARRGVTITAVEPDAAMAALLKARCGSHGRVRLAISPFEDYLPAERFELLFSAHAWHWMDPAVRWRRAADLLSPGGALALFWNHGRIADPAVQERVSAAHRSEQLDIAPYVYEFEDNELMGYWPGTELATLPDFTDHAASLHRSSRVFGRADYLAYLSTHTAYRIIDAAARASLFAAIANVLPEYVTLTVESPLYLGRRTAGV